MTPVITLTDQINFLTELTATLESSEVAIATNEQIETIENLIEALSSQEEILVATNGNTQQTQQQIVYLTNLKSLLR